MERPRRTNWRHGWSRSQTYSSWQHARDRCNNPRSHAWEHYGGRGIRFYEGWEDFSQFIHDVGPRPGPGYEIDRIDPDGDYAPGNVRWVRRGGGDTRDTVRITVSVPGITLEDVTIDELSDFLGINRHTLRWRLRQGAHASELIAPTRPYRRRRR